MKSKMSKQEIAKIKKEAKVRKNRRLTDAESKRLMAEASREFDLYDRYASIIYDDHGFFQVREEDITDFVNNSNVPLTTEGKLLQQKIEHAINETHKENNKITRIANGNKNKEEEMKKTAKLMIGRTIDMVFDPDLNGKIKDHIKIKY